jgi:hypothetical protein
MELSTGSYAIVVTVTISAQGGQAWSHTYSFPFMATMTTGTDGIPNVRITSPHPVPEVWPVPACQWRAGRWSCSDLKGLA